jgi:hypothetical protein
MYDSCKWLQLDIISHATFYFIVTIIQATLGLYAHFILPENVELIFFCSNEKSILLILARFWNWPRIHAMLPTDGDKGKFSLAQVLFISFTSFDTYGNEENLVVGIGTYAGLSLLTISNNNSLL